MPLETATYIDDLVATNPASGDGLGGADDHLRLIKAALLATFPNITGEVTATHDELNSGVPIGTIAMFYSATPPTGWAVCNGQTVSRTDGGGSIVTPDLRDRFILAAGSTYTHADTGGAATDTGTTDSQGGHDHTASASGDHSHGGSTGSYTLLLADIPAHDHDVQYVAVAAGGGAGGYGIVQWASGSAYNTQSQGGGGGHSHTLSASGTHTHSLDTQGAHTHSVTVDTVPPFYCLTFIMRY